MQVPTEQELEQRLKDVVIPELGNLTVAQCIAARDTVREGIQVIRAAFSAFQFYRYTDKERGLKAAEAAMSGGEEEAFHSILNAADLDKSRVRDVADRDHGTDPKEVETDLLRARAFVHKIWREVAEDLKDLAQDILDSAIYTGVLARALDSDLYDILSNAAKRNSTVRSVLAGARNYFSKLTQAARKAQAAKAASGDDDK